MLFVLIFLHFPWIMPCKGRPMQIISHSSLRNIVFILLSGFSWQIWCQFADILKIFAPYTRHPSWILFQNRTNWIEIAFCIINIYFISSSPEFLRPKRFQNVLQLWMQNCLEVKNNQTEISQNPGTSWLFQRNSIVISMLFHLFLVWGGAVPCRGFCYPWTQKKISRSNVFYWDFMM